MIAHSTALESITVEVDSMSVAGVGAGASGVSAICQTSQQILEDELDDTTDYGINNVWGGIPAKNKKGENLLLFVGIIGKCFKFTKNLLQNDFTNFSNFLQMFYNPTDLLRKWSIFGKVSFTMVIQCQFTVQDSMPKDFKPF